MISLMICTEWGVRSCWGSCLEKRECWWMEAVTYHRLHQMKELNSPDREEYILIGKDEPPGDVKAWRNLE